jgi:hypothetical protein
MKIQIVPAAPEVEMPESYYEWMERAMGQEAADWARLPREEREKEIRWYHENFNTPDDLAVWPPELGGGKFDPEEGA